MSIPSGFTIPESKDSDDGPFSSVLLAGMSPDKNGRKKFIKNGLAEKAAHLMSRADTSFSLWRKEKEKEISRSSKPQSRASAAATDSSVTPSLPQALESRTTAHTLVTRTADIKLLIEEIIFLQEVPMAQYLRRKEGDDPPPPLRLGPGVRAVHARCKILSWTRPKEKYEFEFGEPKKAKANDDIEHKPGETMDIWFRLSHGSEPGPRPVSSWDGLEAGKEVYVWRPIHELTKENMLICTRFLCIK
ncbi:hypothetical protein SISNIDRAFT_351105 [Sistotremastrum niveocremeum HHB9708]|uniref:Uncharacterized protein n=1 Tax=Sistotremastrum niveocremeum HHB9708 TaxID=1314777 RepID=A0A164WZY5_9AGAM|nr:hypothetical protein SISNIDRAFT_351105 [Sistotremastrum niveocremeum HHB9708]